MRKHACTPQGKKGGIEKYIPAINSFRKLLGRADSHWWCKDGAQKGEKYLMVPPVRGYRYRKKIRKGKKKRSSENRSDREESEKRQKVQ